MRDETKELQRKQGVGNAAYWEGLRDQKRNRVGDRIFLAGQIHIVRKVMDTGALVTAGTATTKTVEIKSRITGEVKRTFKVSSIAGGVIISNQSPVATAEDEVEAEANKHKPTVDVVPVAADTTQPETLAPEIKEQIMKEGE
jgi:hypothetical protein